MARLYRGYTLSVEALGYRKYEVQITHPNQPGVMTSFVGETGLEVIGIASSHIDSLLREAPLPLVTKGAYCPTCQTMREFAQWTSQPILVCLTCGNVAEETVPQPQDNRPRSYKDLLDFVREQKIDREEYFSLSTGVREEEPLWSPKTVWIAVYWVEGGSEGYYVHVDRIENEKELGLRVNTTMAVGKFWNKASASLAVTYLTPFVYGLSLI